MWSTIWITYIIKWINLKSNFYLYFETKSVVSKTLQLLSCWYTRSGLWIYLWLNAKNFTVFKGRLNHFPRVIITTIYGRWPYYCFIWLWPNSIRAGSNSVPFHTFISMLTIPKIPLKCDVYYYIVNPRDKGNTTPSTQLSIKYF